MNQSVKQVANALLKTACEYKGTDISTLDTLVKEAVPYWEALAKSAIVSTLALPEIKKRMKS